jgi:protoheme IX farnesyltransferase
MSVAIDPPLAVLPSGSTTSTSDRSMSRDIAMLVRPRIALMVLATVATGMWLTDPSSLTTGALFAVLLGTGLVAASSSIANQILERTLDQQMPRTADRPLAAGRMSVPSALWLASLTLVVGMGLLTSVDVWAAAAALGTWLIYVVVYTPLKRRTPLNTAIGAISGATPVMIGWLAAKGPERLIAGEVEGALAAAALTTVLYLWQFPHFMAIAWLYRKQYAEAGMRMLTVEDPTGIRAGGQSLAAALAMVPVSLLLAVPSGSSRLFLAEAFAAGVYVAATAHFAIRRDDMTARRLLMASLGTLAAVMIAVVAFGRPASLPLVAAPPASQSLTHTVDTTPVAAREL